MYKNLFLYHFRIKYKIFKTLLYNPLFTYKNRNVHSKAFVIHISGS